MASTPSGPTLTCAQCNFVNEAERVYCHNCGAKLDRTLLPKTEEPGRNAAEQDRKRVHKMTNPGGSPAAREVKTLFQTLLYAALVAVVIQIVRPPSSVPPAKSEELSLRLISSELQDALEAPRPVGLQFTESEVNAHLGKSLKKKTAGMFPGVQFERAYVRLEPGNVYIGMEQSLFGYALYSGVRHTVSVKDGKLLAINRGGNFGRLAVHPALMKYLVIAFRPLFTALQREKEQMEHMQQILPMKGSIFLATKGRRS